MTATSNALSCLGRAGDTPPFFCVPGAATTPLSLYALSRRLAPERPFYSFRYSGVVDELPVETTIEAMSKRFVAALLATYPSGPYLLGGYCLGGLVALDAAGVLRRRGASVALLALVETIPPLGVSAGDPVGAGDGHAAIDTAALGQALTAMGSDALRHLGNLSASLAAQLRRVWAIHNRAGTDYRPQRMDAPIVLLRTSTHSASLFQTWPRLTNGEFWSVTLGGNTQSILSKPDVVELGDRLGAALDAAVQP